MSGALLRRGATIALAASLALACSDDAVPPTGLSPVSGGVVDFTVNKAEFPIANSASSEEMVFNIASDGTSALVPYTDNASLKLKLITANGGISNVPLSGTQYANWVHVAYGNGYYLVIWYNLFDQLIYAQKVSAAGGASGTPFLVSPATGSYIPTGIAYGSGKFLISFFDLSTYKTRVRFVNLDRSLGAVVNVASSYLEPGANKVASDGTNFLVAYAYSSATGNGLFVRKVTSSGSVSGPTQIDPSINETAQFSVAFSGGIYLVAFDKTRGATAMDVMARRVATNGSVSGSSFVVDGAAGDQVTVQGLKYGNNFLITFMNAPANGNASARARKVSSTGAVGGAQTFYVKASGLVPLPAAAAIGTKVFFAIQRFTLDLSAPNDFWYNVTNSDVKGGVITP